MADELLGGLLPDLDLRFIATVTTGLARKSRDLQKAEPAAAELFAQGLTAAVMMGALQKDNSRVNLQLECDGPLRGFFADADNQGNARGYVKNIHLSFTGNEGEFRWRPALGNSGFLSVLRDLGGGEYYRSSVELEKFDIALDLQRYYAVSEQLGTKVFLDVLPEPGEVLGRVGGLMLQTLPGADPKTLETLEARFRGQTFANALRGDGVRGMIKELFAGERFELMTQVPVQHKCTCSRDRVLQALTAMGKAELEDVLAKEKKAEVTCQFCATHYVISETEIRALLG